MKTQRKHTRMYLEHQYRVFCQLQKLSEVLDLLKISHQHFKNLTEKPIYQSFTVGKRDGGERHIENPDQALKKVQENLNQHLQAVYYFIKTPLAYGFVINSTKEKDRRDILANARLHLGQAFLLNLDLKDFFHNIKVKHIWKVFGSDPMRFNREALEGLTRLTTYKGRLPMGASTSPVLSNFATRDLDYDLHEYALQQHLKVSRYSDDISFSSAEEITPQMQEDIKAIILKHDFVLNEKKIKYFDSEQIKEVTGILLLGEGKLGLPEGFTQEIEEEIKQLESILLVQNRQGKLNTQWVNTFKKHIQGKINFVGYVLGNNTQEKKHLTSLFEAASYPPPEEFGSYSWKSIHYHI